MTEFAEADLTRDGFLGGRLHLWQPRSGYRAGIDPVLLAASVPAEPGQSVLDLGCGVGAALFSLGRRVPGLALTGLDLQPAYAALARRNATDAALAAQIVVGDIANPPAAIRKASFDHVIANPPYFDPSARSAAADPGRDMAQAGVTPLAAWTDLAARRLAPKGWLYVIQRADRLPDLLGTIDHRLGSIEVLPITGRAGRSAKLILLRARKGGRATFRLHAPLILHEGVAHLQDGDSYRSEISASLRDGASLRWPSD